MEQKPSAVQPQPPQAATVAVDPITITLEMATGLRGVTIGLGAQVTLSAAVEGIFRYGECW